MDRPQTPAKPKLKYMKFRDKDGRRIPRHEYQKELQNTLLRNSQEQWKSRPERLLPRDNPTCLTQGKFPIDDSEFTMECQSANCVEKKTLH